MDWQGADSGSLLSERQVQCVLENFKSEEFNPKGFSL